MGPVKAITSRQRTEPLRLTIITPQYPPMSGGVPVLLETFARTLAEAGDDVEVVTFPWGGFEGCVRADHCPTIINIRRVSPVPIRGASALLLALRVLIDLPSRRPDVVLCGTGWPFAGLGLILRLVAGIPYATYFHVLELSGPDRSPLTRWALRLALGQCGAVIVNSHFTETRLRRLGVKRPRPIWLPPCIDASRFASADGIVEIREHYGLAGQRVLLTVGRLVDYKGQDIVLRALPEILRRIPEVTYLLVGDGPSQLRLRRLAAEVGVDEHVRFVGDVGSQDIAAYYHACDVVVMPTREDQASGEVEGFGMTFLEAAAASKPVVAGNAGGSIEAVVAGETGLVVDPEDEHAVAQAVLRLLQDEPLARRLGVAGAQRVKRHFDRRKVGADLRRILQAVADGGAVAPPPAAE